MNVLLLAAGLGTRLRPLTNKHPKPAVPFLNVPLGLYPFRFLKDLPISQLVVNTHHLPEQIESLYKNQPYYKNEIKFSNEKNLILGSAGGLKQASHLFNTTDSDDTLLLLNSDEVFFGADINFLKKAYEQHINQNNLATLVVMKHSEAGKKFGAIWTENTKVTAIGKTPTHAQQIPYHYIGMIFLNKSILQDIPENVESNIFYDVLVQKLNSSKVEIFEINCHWYETGNPTDFFAATAHALENLDNHTLNFINQYDDSVLIKNENTRSLISNSTSLKNINLSGFNVVSKTTNPSLLQNLGSLHNSILFENEILNEAYFKV